MLHLIGLSTQSRSHIQGSCHGRHCCRKKSLFLFSFSLQLVVWMLDDVADSCGSEQVSHNNRTHTEESSSICAQHNAECDCCNSSAQPTLSYYVFRKNIKFLTVTSTCHSVLRSFLPGMRNFISNNCSGF